MKYQQIQRIAKDTITYARQHIKAGMNLIDIRKICEDKMLELGADSFWYWDIGAFVFAGDETTVSISGTEYKTSDRIIDENDIITIDLSPQNKNIWGDYARTLIIQDGNVVELEDITNEETAHFQLSCSNFIGACFLHSPYISYMLPPETP